MGKVEDYAQRRGRTVPHQVVIMALAAIATAWLAPPARAQDTAGSDIAAWTQSYINPFPESGMYKLHVFGDFLAAGLASALPNALAENATVEVARETRNASGLSRPDQFDWSARIRDVLNAGDVHIAVIMLGSNDRGRIRTARGFKDFGSAEWAAAYKARLDDIIKRLSDAKVAVYWMGLPIVADEDARADFERINEVIREQVYLGGIKYIDTWNGFADQFGSYSAFGPSVEGVTKRLRDANGIGFTEDGNAKLAEYAASVIKRDLDAARRERSIPLAGDDEQQAAIASLSRSPGPQSAAAAAGEAGDEEESVGRFSTGTEPGQPSAAAEPRDALQPRTSSRAIAFSDYAPPGEQLAVDIGNDVTALATISPANILSARGARQQLPLSERLYYRVLVQGEKLKAPKGRVDDYTWDGG